MQFQKRKPYTKIGRGGERERAEVEVGLGSKFNKLRPRPPTTLSFFFRLEQNPERRQWRSLAHPVQSRGRGSTPLAPLLTLDLSPSTRGDLRSPRWLPRRRGPAAILAAMLAAQPSRHRRLWRPISPSPARGRGLPRTRSLLLRRGDRSVAEWRSWWPR